MPLIIQQWSPHHFISFLVLTRPSCGILRRFRFLISSYPNSNVPHDFLLAIFQADSSSSPSFCPAVLAKPLTVLQTPATPAP